LLVLHHPSPLVRKTQRIELTPKHYTAPLHCPENSKGSNPLPSTTPPLPLARKLKRIEPTKKHYTTTAEKPFEIFY
jgi:hypothetical protein